MKELALIGLLALLALPALCEGTNTLIEWPGWTIESTEDIWMGHKHTSFPLTQMVDGDPATTWVFSGLGRRWDSGLEEYGITIRRDEGTKSVTADALWIMNGHNKSQELFLRNNRITRLKLYVNDKYLKTVDLTDSMGWHKISIPRKPIRNIGIRFTGFNKGRDNDICVSEIALYDGEKQIDLKMPRAVMYTPGSDCGDGQEFYLIDHAGKRIEAADAEFRYTWSPNGRYVAGVKDRPDSKTPGQIWIADTSSGKVITRYPMAWDDSVCDFMKWKGNDAVVAEIDTCVQVGGPDEYECETRTETIKVTGK